jgi:hypothetical protein
MALRLTQSLTGIFPGGKGGRCVGLTTLPPSCADYLEIWEPQPPGTLCTYPVMGVLYLTPFRHPMVQVFHLLLTYLLTPWSRVLPEKLTSEVFHLLLTYLLTYSMEQSPSWEANQWSIPSLRVCNRLWSEFISSMHVACSIHFNHRDLISFNNTYQMKATNHFFPQLLLLSYIPSPHTSVRASSSPLQTSNVQLYRYFSCHVTVGTEQSEYPYSFWTQETKQR